MPERKKMQKVPSSGNTHNTVKLTEEQNKKLRLFINMPLVSANSLMKQLYADDHYYETATYAWVGPEDAKKLFLYGVCKEVIKSCVGLMNDQEFVQEVPKGDNPKPMEKLILGSILDVQTYRIRKMIELLSILILFHKKTKEDKEYRIYLSAENLDLRLARQADFKDLYEKRIIFNTQQTIDDFNNRIIKDMEDIKVTDLWFLNIDNLKRKNPSVFASRKQLFLKALLDANPEERLALGISYGRGYSRTSQSVHPLIGSHDYGKNENKTDDIFSNFSYLSIILMNIMRLAYKIAGLEDPKGLEKIMGPDLEKSDAPEIIGKLKKEFKPGDIALSAWGDLVEIIEGHTSKYGYKAYKIKFISRPPLPEFLEDWMESGSITARLMTESKVRKFFEKAMQSKTGIQEVDDIMKEVVKQSDSELMNYAKGFFKKLHESKLLIPMLLETGFLKKNKKFQI